MTGHVLTIGPGNNGHIYEGHLTFTDGTEEWFYADERVRVISKAQMAIEAKKLASEVEKETLVLDEFGEIIREPIEWSTKA